MRWEAIAQELGGSQPIGYREFDAIWKAEEQQPPEKQPFHQLVQSYGTNGLKLKTHQAEPDQGGEAGEDILDRTAKHAASAQ